jgi:hypothetical protein
MAENLAEGLEREIKRNRDLLEVYKEIPTGGFGAAMIEQDINNAVSALASGDVTKMVRAYEAMKNNE